MELLTQVMQIPIFGVELHFFGYFLSNGLSLFPWKMCNSGMCILDSRKT